jgi:capsular exopolysaccharide synthesis family protein
MMDKGRRKFRLGDIIQKLNEAAGDAGNEPGPLPPETPAPKTDTPRLFPRPPEHVPPPPSDAAVPPASPVRVEQPPRGATPPPAAPREAAGAGRTPSPAESLPSEDDAPFDLMKYVGVLVRRKNIIIAVAALAAVVALVGYVRSVKLYTAHAKMLFSPGFQDIMSENIGTQGSWNRDEQRFNTHLALLKSETLLKRVCRNLGAKIAVEDIQTELKVTRGSFNGTQNDIVDIVFRHPSPETARDVANQICHEYIDYMREVNVSDLTGLITKLEDQIGKMEIEVDNKENALRAFKENNRSVELSQEANLTVTKLSNMELAQQQTNLDIMENKNRLTQIRKEIDQQDINVIQSMTYSNPFQTKLADLELRLNSASAEYSPEHFKVKMLKNEIEKIKEALKTDITKEAESRTLIKNPIRESLLQEVINLAIEKSAAETKHEAQAKMIRDFDQELYKLPSLQLQFAQITRETESSVAILKLLKSRYEEAKIKRDSQESDLKILEWAPLPVSGKSSMTIVTMLLYFLIGVVLGVILAFLVEFLDQSIKDPQQVERGLEVPLLGIVPLIEMEKGIIDSSEAKWKTILEPFRALRATLKHLAETRNIKTFLICSAVKGEGKTTLAANISITFALDGKKVILVDGDMRRAQMHALFNLPKKNGLADYLTGASDMAGVLKKTVHENLLVITAGEHPPNPAELIGNERFERLATELRGMADYVIFDSPALLPVSDGLSMAPKVDACLMLVRVLWTPMKAAIQAKGQLTRIGCGVMGAILNGISHSRGYYPYYYGYYRYYSYQYSYEEGRDADKRFSMREFGLALELRVRNAFRALVFSLPRYTASALGFVRHLMRRKTFWVLLAVFLLLSLLPAGLKMFGIRSHRGSVSFVGGKPDIQYLSQAGRAADSGATLEDIAAGGSTRRADSSTHATTPVAAADSSQEARNLFTAISDSLRLWEKAFNDGDAMRYFSFYDSTRFMYPSGGFKELTSEMTAAMNRQKGSQSIHIDSIWSEPAARPLYRISFNGTGIAGSDTSRRRYSVIWERSNDRWRIIREKYGALP